jgi:hypothetical protein
MRRPVFVKPPGAGPWIVLKISPRFRPASIRTVNEPLWAPCLLRFLERWVLQSRNDDLEWIKA